MRTFIQRRPDGNHKEIVGNLEKKGAKVIDLSGAGKGVSDIVTHVNETVFIELKYGEKANVKKTQVYFMATWPGHCGFATNLDEAWALATDPQKRALTKKQKNKLLQYYARMTEKAVNYTTLMKEIGGTDKSRS